MSKLLAGISASQAAGYNARAAESEGLQAQNDGVAAEAQVRDEARYAAGEAIAAQGQSGLQLGTGSALDVLRESALNAELDRMRLRTRAENQRRAKKHEAALQRSAGRSALAAGILGTVTDVAIAAVGGGGGGQSAGQRATAQATVTERRGG